MVSDGEIAADWEARCLGEISYLQRNIGELNAIREDFPDDWEMEELTRAIIHDEFQMIESLMGEIQDGRKEL